MQDMICGVQLKTEFSTTYDQQNVLICIVKFFL